MTRDAKGDRKAYAALYFAFLARIEYLVRSISTSRLCAVGIASPIEEAHRHCCGCFTPSFALKHVVWANMSGKTVLVFAGGVIALDGYGRFQTFTRVVSGVNSLCMLLGQLWYSSYWTMGRGEGVDTFLAQSEVEAQSGGRPAHALLACDATCWLPCYEKQTRVRPSLWMFAASLYYLAFFFLFLFVHLNSEETQADGKAYALVASLWHAVVFFFLFSACFMQCFREQNLSKGHQVEKDGLLLAAARGAQEGRGEGGLV